MKMCTKCNIAKETSAFPSRNGKEKAMCKSCVNQYMREYYNKNPEKKARQRLYHLKHVDFGNVDPVNLLGGPCEICGSNPADTIDHCHKTNKFRGAICRSCNLLLGFSMDKVEVLASAIKYLNERQ